MQPSEELILKYRQGLGSPVAQWMNRHGRGPVSALSAVAALLLWEWAVNTGLINPLLLSSPTQVVRAAIELAQSGELWDHVRISGQEYLLGLAIALGIGIPVAYAMGGNRRVYALLNPFVSALFVTPRIALLPLIIIWTGIGIWSKVVVVALSAIFPLMITVAGGVRTVDRSWLKAARSFGASPWDTWRTVVLPGTVPFLLTGVRLATVQGLIGMVVGEFIAAVAGLGYLITVGSQQSRMDWVLVGAVLVAVTGIVLDALLKRLEKRFGSYRGEHRGI